MSKFKKIIDEKVNVDVVVQIDDPKHLVCTRLNLNDNLINIREKLKQNTEIEMDVTLSFTKKISNVEFAKIPNEDEDNKVLNDIIDNGENKLYLVKNLKPNVKFLNEKCKLEHGRTMTPDGIKVADGRAFTMKVKECKMNEFGAEGCREDKIQFNSSEDMTIKTTLSFMSDINLHDFAKFGLSIGKSETKTSTSETSSTCNFKEVGKVSLKFKLEPTTEFISEVENVIKCNKPEKFKVITKKYGRFISEEVILGGRTYYKGVENLKESSKGKTHGVAGNVGVPIVPSSTIGIGIENNSENLTGNTNYFKRECFTLIGGNSLESFENFDEKAWIKSLEDFRTWDCIKFKKPVSIFCCLPENLRKDVFELAGKKILYLNNDLEVPNENIFDLKKIPIPSYILDIIETKDAECSIFATVVDTAASKNDFFNCQILQAPNRKPQLMIHCIQQSPKKREYKLKIGLMVIGYDINFDFIHSDFDAQFKVLETKIEKSSSLDHKKFLEFEYDEEVCFGIPVLSKSNNINTPVIGHHFINDQENNRIGTYTFSYSLKKRHYVELPDFTFHTLIISNHPSSSDCGFKCDFGYSVFNLFNFAKPKQKKTKYVSLYSTGEDSCGPIFLKQKPDEIKIKHIVSCKHDSCICKNKPRNDLKYAFFDPFQDELAQYSKSIDEKFDFSSYYTLK